MDLRWEVVTPSNPNSVVYGTATLPELLGSVQKELNISESQMIRKEGELIFNWFAQVHLRQHVCFFPVCVCAGVCACAQGCNEGSTGVAAYPWTDMAVWCFGTFLHRHGVHLHPPQLPTGTHTDAHAYTHRRCWHHLVKLKQKE